MKRLILIRHGKSSWKEDLPDHMRPLKKRGYRDGEAVSKAFKEFYTAPAHFWSSPAVRALETAKIFKNRLKVPDEDFEIVKDLYTFNEDELLGVIRACKDQVEKLIVFGHNPAMTNVVNFLGDNPMDNLPTTGLCVIDFEEDSWKNIKNGKILVTLLPKNLR
ncbi:histidine phosphatase family protein [Zunongwangia sp. F363]|uniref:Histidine phosphatase family protein n=1 Tax=Autumnicola tepida TaxID=3075595 RepID=A0ABU3CEG9_9FLAO|nr:histidine phosphatase family protein [Zunongwangia sp. F363]MDT0644380.1 histidine phosphatase family protein [Zunongwangia sp. F363]